MAEKLSEGLVDARGELRASAANLYTATTISFEDGTGTDNRDRIADTAGGLGGIPGDKVTVAGSTSNNVTATILAVDSGGDWIEVPAGTLSTEAAGDQVIIATASGGSMVDLMRNGVIDIYTGTQPTDADSAETGTLLVTITLSGGSFTPGSPTNGINFDAASGGVLAKDTGETWSGTAVATGTAGWFRFYDNDKTTGASTSAIRFDGAIATSGAELNMANTSITSGGTVTIDSFDFTIQQG